MVFGMVFDSGPQDNLSDPVNLRCFDQKRRFGIDFLYPTDRYVNGLTDPLVATRDGSMVDNPLYTGNRSPDLVMMAGIVGVPWQDVATEPKALATGYRPAGKVDWSLVLGDPATHAPPGDPLMVESIEPCNASRLDCVTALAKRVTSTWWRSPARWSFAALSAAFSLRVRVRASMSVHVAATSAPTAMITSIQLRRRDRGCSAT